MKYYDILKICIDYTRISFNHSDNHFLISNYLQPLALKFHSLEINFTQVGSSRMQPENYHKRRHGFQIGFVLPDYSIFIRYRFHDP